MSLYVTRHGETDYNVKDLVCGISEAKLTEKGIEQANRLAHSLQKINYKYLYVSPLQRAIDTYEGVHRKCKEFLSNKNNLAYRYPGGESFIELCKRVYGFLDEIKEQATSADVLLVCHGAVCRAIHSYFNDMTNEEIFYFQTDNCELLKYEY